MAEPTSPDLPRHSDWSLIKQGAEARVYSCKYFGKQAIVKERFPKTYRVSELDEKLTHQRIGQEVRSLARCRRYGVRAPAVYNVDRRGRIIVMERVCEGKLVKEYIEELMRGQNGGGGGGSDVLSKGEGNGEEREGSVGNREGGSGAKEDKEQGGELDRGNNKPLSTLVQLMGAVIAQIHDADIIHGDLTTSNMIYDQTAGHVTLIDFGLSGVSGLAEDKAVDLYVLERAFLSTHPNTEQQFQELLQSYRQSSKKAAVIIARLDEVRLRGRKRTMVG